MEWTPKKLLLFFLGSQFPFFFGFEIERFFKLNFHNEAEKLNSCLALRLFDWSKFIYYEQCLTYYFEQ